MFIAVAGAHLLWRSLFPEQDPAQPGWLAIPSERGWLRAYVEDGAYWLGYAYGISVAFAFVAVREYLAEGTGAARNAALGGVTFSGGLALAGCFLVGCCGSPMLAVWSSLFGAAFLPIAKPLVAAVSTVTIALAGWRLGRSRGRSGRDGRDALLGVRRPPRAGLRPPTDVKGRIR